MRKPSAASVELRKKWARSLRKFIEDAYGPIPVYIARAIIDHQFDAEIDAAVAELLKCLYADDADPAAEVHTETVVERWTPEEDGDG